MNTNSRQEVNFDTGLQAFYKSLNAKLNNPHTSPDEADELRSLYRRSRTIIHFESVSARLEELRKLEQALDRI